MKEIFSKEIDELKNAIESKCLVFLVGAGISSESPSYISTMPQSECIEALSTLNLDLENKIIENVRPEMFFQVMYNIIGNRALVSLGILDPSTLNSEEELVSPNSLHFFLAGMLLKGHIILTTNFDDLIERAHEYITHGTKPKVVIYDEDFQNLYVESDSLKTGCLIKIHGSFLTPDGKDCRDSIIAILQQVQKEFPKSKGKIIEKLIAEHDLIVMGYSGRDDFDLYQYLLKPPSDRCIWWIKHSNEKEDTKWEILQRHELKEKIKKIDLKPVHLKDYGVLNPCSIVLAYSQGVLIEAYTAKFVKCLGEYYSHTEQLDETGTKVKGKMHTILKHWTNTINFAEKHNILAGIFEIAGKDFLDLAQEHYNKASEINTRLIKAQNILKSGRIHYKKSKKEEYNVAKDELEKALKEFEELSSITDQAEASLQLLLVYNRLGFVDEGIKNGERAINYYFQLAEIDNSKIFELARALRGLALISIRGIPDISAITKIEEKKRCTKILKDAFNLCQVSLQLLRKIGNRSGERGEGQTLNVLGLIKLRLSQNFGDYKETWGFFNEFLDLSGRSRFSNESFQGHRNLALCEYNLALKGPESDRKKRLDKAIQDYDHAIKCLGGDPEKIDQQLRTPDEFITRYNKDRAKIERGGREELEFTLQELTMLKNSIPNIFSAYSVCHWSNNILFALSKINSELGQDEETFKCLEKMTDEYEGVEDKDIEKQPFGVQNALENLQFARDWLKQLDKAKEIEELYQKIVKQLERVSILSQYVPPILLKDWSIIISKIQAKFLSNDV